MRAFHAGHPEDERRIHYLQSDGWPLGAGNPLMRAHGNNPAAMAWAGGWWRSALVKAEMLYKQGVGGHECTADGWSF